MRLVKDEASVIERILEAIRLGADVVAIFEDIAEVLEQVVESGGLAALGQVGFADDEAIVSLVNERAVQYARERAAEMVGKKWIGGELIDNPSAKWRIDEATREMVRSLVTQGVEEGWSNDRLASALTDHYAFSDDRAEVIARTETAFADVEGNLTAWRETGEVTAKQWLTAPGCCDECQELDGVIVPLDGEFPAAGGAPPLHPNCRCDVLPVLKDVEG